MNKTINELINKQKSDLNILGAPDRKWSTFGNLKTLSSYVNSKLRSYGVDNGAKLHDCTIKP